MKKFRIFVSALALAAASFSADAIVAKRDVMTVTQPDGSTLRIKKVGDEILHFTMTEDNVILHEENGVFTYGRVAKDGSVSSTGVIATNPDARKIMSSAVTTNLADLDLAAIEATPAIQKRRAETVILDKQTPASRAIEQSGMGRMRSASPNRGNVKGLIILVEYKDVKFTHPNPAQYFSDMINKPGFSEYGGTGSALDFFTENSNGVFTPDFDVYGPVTLSNNRAYYGAASGSQHDVRAYAMITEACRALDNEVDFSQYDTDGDGQVDNVFVFYAGQGQASYGPEESVWPHAWYVLDGAGVTCKLDNVLINRYACTNEWEQNRPDGVGTFIHEFSHVMGLPDLYCTSGTLTCTPGAWSCMDYGPYNNSGCTPPNYGAYERNALGWIDPIVLDKPMTVSLDEISGNRCAIIPTEKNTEFFLLENRQNNGWDAYVPGHGLMVWHIDFEESVFTRNSVNNNASHQYVDIVEAGGTANTGSMAVMAQYPFPGTKGVTSLTATTTPALVSWAGNAINVPITDITEEDGIVTFNVMGGGERLATPVAKSAVTGDDYFVASWNTVAGATDYLLSVTAYPDDEKFDEKADFGQGNISEAVLPAGWTSSVSPAPTYTNTNNFVEMPSLKMSVADQSLTTRVFPSDVNYISFWHRGQTAPTLMSSTISVLGLIDGQWVELAVVSPSGMSANTFELSNIPLGVRQVKLVLNFKKGAVAIDNVVVRGGGKSVDLFTNKSTEGKTEVRVDNLLKGYNKYSYTVKAKNDIQVTRSSDPVNVILANGVEDIVVDGDVDADAPARYFNLQGVELSHPVPGTLVIERRGNKARKIIVR